MTDKFDFHSRSSRSYALLYFHFTPLYFTMLPCISTVLLCTFLCSSVLPCTFTVFPLYSVSMGVSPFLPSLDFNIIEKIDLFSIRKKFLDVKYNTVESAYKSAVGTFKRGSYIRTAPLSELCVKNCKN
jgi:hypothetical protein